MTRALLTLLLFALGLAAAPPSAALAQDTDDPVELARRHFEAARAYFGAERYDDAALEFETAHELLPNAELLFNAALSHERATHTGRAMELYERYLVEYPTGDDIVEAGRHLAELRERAHAEARDPLPDVDPAELVVPDPAPDAGPDPVDVRDAPASAGPDVGLLGLGGGLASLGLVAGAVAIALGVAALDDLAALEAGCPGDVCGEELRATHEQYTSFALANTVLLPVAGALLVSGLITVIVAATSGSPAESSGAPRALVF